MFDALTSKSWIADGIDEAKREVLGNVRAIADNDEDAALQLLALPFLDAIDPADGSAVESLASFVSPGPSNALIVFNALMEKSWVADGLDEVEIEILDNIRSIAGNDKPAALRLITLPFLDTIESADGPAVESLASFVTSVPSNSLLVFNALTEESWVADGLDELEIGILGNIHSIAENDEPAALRLLALPFLHTVEPDDTLTMDTLAPLTLPGQNYSPQALDAFIAQHWIADGIDDVEREPVEKLVRLAAFYPSVFDALINRFWVIDTLNEVESEVISRTLWLATNNSSLALQVAGLPLLDTVETADIAALKSFDSLLALRAEGRFPLQILDAIVAKS